MHSVLVLTAASLLAPLAYCTQQVTPPSPKEVVRRYHGPVEDPPFQITKTSHTIKGTLGGGASGKVYLFTANEGTPGPEQLAVKVVMTKGAKYDVIDNAIKEMKLLMVLEHPNLMKMHSGYITTASVIMACEYYPDGSLEKYEHGKPLFKTLPKERIVKIAKGLFKAIEYLHSLGVIHLDVKPANVMLHEDSVKLIDLGFSTEPTETERKYNRPYGTPLYCAPEMFLQKQYGKGPDIWSAGVTIWILFANPFENDVPLNMNSFCQIFLDRRGPWSGREQIAEELQPVIEGAIKFEEKDRMTATEILSLPCFAEPIVQDLEPKVSELKAEAEPSVPQSLEITEPSVPQVEEAPQSESTN